MGVAWSWRNTIFFVFMPCSVGFLVHTMTGCFSTIRSTGICLFNLSFRPLKVGNFFADRAHQILDLASLSSVLSMLQPFSLDIPSILSLIEHFSGV